MKTFEIWIGLLIEEKTPGITKFDKQLKDKILLLSFQKNLLINFSFFTYRLSRILNTDQSIKERFPGQFLKGIEEFCNPRNQADHIYMTCKVTFKIKLSKG